MRKLVVIILIAFLSGCTWTITKEVNTSQSEESRLNTKRSDSFNILEKFNVNKRKLDVPRIQVDSDKNGDGIKDMDDILEGARKDAANKPRYRSAYYRGGYPPDNEGVCTDVIWRALKNAGYNLKEMVDKDIQENIEDYPRVAGKPDPNIDFRRVKNLIPFFKKHALVLTTKVVPWDKDNLKKWQGGDIVVFGEPLEHIAIVSDKRREDGVPYIIHNGGPYTKENDQLLDWPSPIVYHFRFPKQK